MLDITLLSEEQVFGKNKLEIIKEKGAKAPITDFSILLGVSISPINLNGSTKLENRSGYYWTKTAFENKVSTVDYDGNRYSDSAQERSNGARPVIEFSLIKDYCSSLVQSSSSILEVEFGEYPQKALSKKMQDELEERYTAQSGSINKTGKIYTVDSRDPFSYDYGFMSKELIEYEYKGKRYVRVEANTYYSGQKVILSSELKVKDGDYVWIEVLPIKWLVDKKENLAVSEKVLFAGIQFKSKHNSSDNFESSRIKKYMDKYFSIEIIPKSLINKSTDKEQKKKFQLQNSYKFNYENVTEEDLIRGSLESNIAPFLHGKSSEGKSARIKEFDPDAEIVYLRNATPDSLNGKSVYDSKNNRMIDVPPTWYVKLKEKCEKEPDKLHIVFFDELTNALPSIQGMAFNIILDKEINGKWKLPENARVAAAGNDLEDSLAANTMAEPLFNRFNHVYINTTVEDWLSWALTPNNTYERLDYKKDENTKQLKIHPAIYTYIACEKEAVLRTKYTGVKPNADPRKWEMASKVLYQTNNPYMLRGLIGEDLTNDFVAFCKTKVITVEDVINYNYDENNFRINVAEKYLTVLSLSNVDEENLEVVRNFIEKLGKEYLALFDSLWTIGDDERLERLMSLKQIKTKVISL